jgi:hypothetical protein
MDTTADLDAEGLVSASKGRVGGMHFAPASERPSKFSHPHHGATGLITMKVQPHPAVGPAQASDHRFFGHSPQLRSLAAQDSRD